MRAAWLLGAALCLLAAGARGDPPPVFNDCSQPVYTVKNKGSSFSVNCEDGVIVFTPAKARQLFGEREKMAETIALLEQRKALSDAALQLVSQIRTQYEEMRKIDDRSFAQAKDAANRAVSLGEAATRNTEEALKLARRTRLASYVSTGLVGATAGAGGLYLGTHEFWPTALGALGGALAGMAVNHFVLNLGAP